MGRFAGFWVLGFVTLFVGRGFGQELQGQKPKSTSCEVNHTSPNEGDVALAQEDFEKALTLYKEMAGKRPWVSRAGLIRALLGQDKIGEASDSADKWLKEEPRLAIALATEAEVLLRQGEIPEAYAMAQKAMAADPCDARIYLVYARAEALSANFLASRNHVELAHRLAPSDIEARKAWAFGLPKKQRMQEVGFLLGEHLFNARDAGRIGEAMSRTQEGERGACKLTTPLERTTIPMGRIVNDSRRLTVGVDVTLNGKRRRLEIDTGASGLLLTRSGAASLGLVRADKIGVGGIGDQGEAAASTAYVDSVRIGGLEFHDCVVRIVEKGGSLDVDGLIGGNVFRNFLLTLDFPKGQIGLGPLPKRPDEVKPESTSLSTESGAAADDEVAPKLYDRYVAPEMKDWTRVYRSGHLLLVPMSIGESRNRLFVVDTGASTMLISPDAARAVTKVGKNYDDRIRGLSGEVNKVYETGKFTLTFAHLRQHVDGMTSIDTSNISHNLGLEVSGFLGAPILQRLTFSIDYRDNLMEFKYQQGN